MKRLVLFGVVTGVALSVVGGVSFAAGGVTPKSSASAQYREARSFVPFGVPNETKYVPIAPCRAVDTRTDGGALASGSQRTVSLASCNVPIAATAVAATLTTVATHSGYLKAWSAFASEPPTSFMNYGTAFNASSGGTVPIGLQEMSVKNFGGPTQVIVDINGYYVLPMAGQVNSDGTISTATGITRTVRDATGIYSVYFRRNVRDCAASVTAQSDDDVVVDVVPAFDDATGITVAFYDLFSDHNQNSAFNIVVTC